MTVFLENVISADGVILGPQSDVPSVLRKGDSLDVNRLVGKMAFYEPRRETQNRPFSHSPQDTLSLDFQPPELGWMWCTSVVHALQFVVAYYSFPSKLVRQPPTLHTQMG